MTERFRGIALAPFFVLLGATSVSADDTAAVDFERDVAPIIQQHCITCHRPGNAKGEMSLATAEDLRAAEYVVPGKPDESYLIELVTWRAISCGARPGAHSGSHKSR